LWETEGEKGREGRREEEVKSGRQGLGGRKLVYERGEVRSGEAG